MMRMKRPLEAVIEAIHAAKSIALVSHISPDGDTTCSALAMRLGLTELGKNVTLFCQDKTPDEYHFLPGAGNFRAPETAEEHYDLLLCLDVSDESRMGRCNTLMAKATHTAQVDHHDTNTNYCDINFIDGSAPANCLILYELLQRLGCTITKDVALCLAVGLSTDTGHLTYNSTTPEAYRVMGDLVEAGAPVAEAYRRLYRERPPRQVALLVRALHSLTFYDEGRITSIRLTQQDFAACWALPEDAEIIVNNGLDILGVRMCVFAREQEDGSVKLSFRAIPPYKVSGVALSFGGGGHAQAAGAAVQMPLDEAITQAVARMKHELEQNA